LLLKRLKNVRKVFFSKMKFRFQFVMLLSFALMQMKVTKEKIKANPIAPRVLPGQRLPLCNGTIYIGFFQDNILRCIAIFLNLKFIVIEPLPAPSALSLKKYPGDFF